uniref:BHLH domain-containing protein n=1 Tax=Picea sitchensis TaxID=3332 RepID=A9NQC2_PICSI|nr:unknown [Picea sitchensis]
MEYCNRQESVTEPNLDHDQASAGCKPREPKSIDHKKSAQALKLGELGLGNSLMKSIEPEDQGIHIWTERERRKKMRSMFSNLHSLLPHLPAKADKSTIVEEAISYIKTLQQSLHVLENQRLDKARAASTLEFELSSTFHEMQQQHHVSTATMRSASEAPAFYHPLTAECSASSGFEPWISRQYSRTISTGSPAIDHCFFQTWSSPNVVLSVCGDDAHMMICSSPPKQGLLTTIFYTLEKHKVDVVTAHISSDSCRSMYMIHAQAHAMVNGGDQFLESKASEEAFRSAAGELVFYLSS